MKLTYRGASYDLSSAHVDVVDAPVDGQYRGSLVHFHLPVNLPAVQQVLHLMYRGVPFDEEIIAPAS